MMKQFLAYGKTNNGRRPSKGAIVLSACLLILLPAEAFVPYGPSNYGDVISKKTALPQGFSNTNEALDSLANQLMSVDAIEKFAGIGRNIANMKMEDMRLNEVDESIGFSAHERLYTAALVFWVGVSQRKAGREEFKNELVNQVAAGELTIEEAMADIALAAKTAVARQIEVQKSMDETIALEEQRRLEAELKAAETSRLKQERIKEKKEASDRRKQEQEALKQEALKQKEEKRENASKKKEDNKKRLRESMAKAKQLATEREEAAMAKKEQAKKLIEAKKLEAQKKSEQKKKNIQAEKEEKERMRIEVQQLAKEHEQAILAKKEEEQKLKEINSAEIEKEAKEKNKVIQAKTDEKVKLAEEKKMEARKRKEDNEKRLQGSMAKAKQLAKEREEATMAKKEQAKTFIEAKKLEAQKKSEEKRMEAQRKAMVKRTTEKKPSQTKPKVLEKIIPTAVKKEIEETLIHETKKRIREKSRAVDESEKQVPVRKNKKKEVVRSRAAVETMKKSSNIEINQVVEVPRTRVPKKIVEPPRASPLAKILASEHGVDLAHLTSGSGQNGRILADDVRAFVTNLEDAQQSLFFANTTAS